MCAGIPFLKLIEGPIIAGRAVSVLSGMASIAGIFLVTYALFKSKKLSILSSFLYAVSPFTVFFDRLALADSMLTMFGIWTLFFAIKTVQTKQYNWAMLTGFTLGGAWLTKSPAIFFFALLPLTILITNITPKTLFKKVFDFFPFWLTSWAIGFVIYNILRLGPEFYMISVRNKDYVYPLSHLIESTTHPMIIHLTDSFSYLWYMLPGSILLAAFLGIYLSFKKYKRETILLAAWFIFHLIVQSGLAKVITARYLLFTIPTLFIFGALFINTFKKKQYLIASLVVILPALYINYLLLTQPSKAPLPRSERGGYLEAWTAGTGIPEIAKYLKAERLKNPKQAIVVGTEGYFGTLPDGLQIYFDKDSKMVVKGVGLALVEVDPSLIEAKRSGDRAFLVANASRLDLKLEKHGLNLIAEYPKAVKDDGTQDKLLLMEVTEKAVEIYNLNHAQNN